MNASLSGENETKRNEQRGKKAKIIILKIESKYTYL